MTFINRILSEPATATGRGSSDVIQPDTTGMLLPPGDVDAFCRHSQALMDDAAEASRLGENAKNHVRSFASENSISMQLDAIEKLLNISYEAKS